jgi:hypothetical protein
MIKMRTKSFQWANKTYLISEEADKYKFIVLPNGMVLEPTGYDYQTPANLFAKIIEHPFISQSITTIALTFGNAILAWEK